MKLTIIFILISFGGMGQITKGNGLDKTDSIKLLATTWPYIQFKINPAVGATFIAFLISPTIPKDSTWTDKEIWLKELPHYNLFQYKQMMDDYHFVPKPGYKVVNIRFDINGRITDYTFEEFRKILFD